MRPSRASLAFWLLCLNVLGSGCALVEDANRNIYLALTTPIEVHREKARNERWAEEAWHNYAMKEKSVTHSEDFALGFKQGFAEYLFRGGNDELPLAAPLRYRHIRYQNPEGYQAIQDWFTGFQLGANLARDSGVRRWITGPTALHLQHSAALPPQPPIDVPTLPEPKEQGLIPLPLPRDIPVEINMTTPANRADGQGLISLPQPRGIPVEINTTTPPDRADGQGLISLPQPVFPREASKIAPPHPADMQGLIPLPPPGALPKETGNITPSPDERLIDLPRGDALPQARDVDILGEPEAPRVRIIGNEIGPPVPVD